MRAQYDDFVSLNAACERNLDVGARDASHLIVLALHRTATPRPLLHDIVSCRMQRVWPEHVALANVSRKNIHMALQRRSQVGDVRSLHAIHSKCRNQRNSGISVAAAFTVDTTNNSSHLWIKFKRFAEKGNSRPFLEYEYYNNLSFVHGAKGIWWFYITVAQRLSHRLRGKVIHS
jgi:hypothetical protein